MRSSVSAARMSGPEVRLPVSPPRSSATPVREGTGAPRFSPPAVRGAVSRARASRAAGREVLPVESAGRVSDPSSRGTVGSDPGTAGNPWERTVASGLGGTGREKLRGSFGRRSESDRAREPGLLVEVSAPGATTGPRGASVDRSGACPPAEERESSLAGERSRLSAVPGSTGTTPRRAPPSARAGDGATPSSGGSAPPFSGRAGSAGRKAARASAGRASLGTPLSRASGRVADPGRSAPSGIEDRVERYPGFPDGRSTNALPEFGSLVFDRAAVRASGGRSGVTSTGRSLSTARKISGNATRPLNE
jgi:hypothetical protein